MTDRHKTIISDKLATYLAMMFIAALGAAMVTAMWFSNQPEPPVLDPDIAYCHAWMETQEILGAPASVRWTFDACMDVLGVTVLFDDVQLQGPLLPGEESMYEGE